MTPLLCGCLILHNFHTEIYCDNHPYYLCVLMHHVQNFTAEIERGIISSCKLETRYSTGAEHSEVLKLNGECMLPDHKYTMSCGRYTM